MEDRLERRSSFNAYVEDQLRKEAGETKRWSLSYSGAYGYDDNVTLDSARRSDEFNEHFGRVALRAPHGGAGFFGPGEAGLQSSVLWRDYGRVHSLDNARWIERPYVTFGFLGGTTDLSYAFEWLRYENNAPLDYVRNRLEAGQSWRLLPGLSHRPYYSFSAKNFLERHAIGADANTVDRRRQDLSQEVGHEMTLDACKNTRLGFQSRYEWIDSNDVFIDFNDFERLGLAGFVEHKFGPWTGVGRVGYEHKDYGNRTFASGLPLETQYEDYYYVSTNLYLSVTKNARLGFGYLFGQNHSNNAAQEYSFSNFTGGLYLDF